MFRLTIFNRLSVRLTIAFLLAAILVIALVAVLAYRYTSSDFSAFLTHMEDMDRIMGGGMMGAMGMGSQALAQATIDFQDNLRQTLWLAGFLGVALALFLGALFTRQIVAPLSRVTTAARRVAQGDLGHRVEVHGSGELAELGQSFNKMASSLEGSEQSRRRLMADIVHELRTPLTVIEGTVDSIMDGVYKPDQEHLGSIKEQSALLTRLISDLRDLSLAESGQLELKLAATDMVEVLRHQLTAAKPAAREKNVRLKLNAPAKSAEVSVDPIRIEQVIANLMANAIRHTPAGGDVTISVKTVSSDKNHQFDRPHLVISVADSGEGITPEHLRHVFERFYRVEDSRSRSEGGSGLGLAIVKQMVKAHGGRVWAESEVGRGSIFYIALPL